MANPIALYYAANWMHRHRIPVLPRLLQAALFLLCGAVVPYRTRIGRGCLLGHGGSGIVIHEKATIGNGVMICQQVTIGGTGIGSSLPVIGDDVYLGAGARILGAVEIGSSSVVGANAVVIRSVPPRSVAAGVPARIVAEGIDAHSVEEW